MKFNIIIVIVFLTSVIINKAKSQYIYQIQPSEIIKNNKIRIIEVFVDSFKNLPSFIGNKQYYNSYGRMTYTESYDKEKMRYITNYEYLDDTVLIKKTEYDIVKNKYRIFNIENDRFNRPVKMVLVQPVTSDSYEINKYKYYKKGDLLKSIMKINKNKKSRKKTNFKYFENERLKEISISSRDKYPLTIEFNIDGKITNLNKLKMGSIMIFQHELWIYLDNYYSSEVVSEYSYKPDGLIDFEFLYLNGNFTSKLIYNYLYYSN